MGDLQFGAPLGCFIFQRGWEPRGGVCKNPRDKVGNRRSGQKGGGVAKKTPWKTHDLES